MYLMFIHILLSISSVWKQVCHIVIKNIFYKIVNLTRGDK